MNIIEIIEKKRDHKTFCEKEIQYFVDGYVNDEVKDYQISALLMAICINGMDLDEVYALTKAMIDSGDVIDLSSVSGIKVDKHSTGGVGDKTSLVLGPIMAACNLTFVKMSGRGLSHTGGTLDKLEAISNFNTTLDKDRFIKQLNDIQIAIMGQSDRIVPADKKLYALRDVTGSVPSIPLIASSIMAKKLAANADLILLDVKYGDGAFMKTKEVAEELATTMIAIGKKFNKTVKAIITNMEEPLGNAIGNSIEVIEAINTLKGCGPTDFTKLCIHSACTLLLMANKAESFNDAQKVVEQVIRDGSAFHKLMEMVQAQEGDIAQILHPQQLKQSKFIIQVTSLKDGYIHRIHARRLGLLACELGAGRKTKEDKIIHEVGIILHKKGCAYVKKGDVLCEIHTNKQLNSTFIVATQACFEIDNRPCVPTPLIYKTI